MNTLKRILLVEDDPKDVELILSTLGEYNLANEIAVARDGADALDYLYCRGAYATRPRGNPVVILLQLKSDDHLRSVPVVILTSSRETSDLDECYRLGVNAYVVKPVRFAEFIEAVKGIGVFWALINEPPPFNEC
jgi:CheY-like chemotaxis protein